MSDKQKTILTPEEIVNYAVNRGANNARDRLALEKNIVRFIKGREEPLQSENKRLRKVMELIDQTPEPSNQRKQISWMQSVRKLINQALKETEG